MRFFTDVDFDYAVEIMLRSPVPGNPSTLGLMGGIKRRARARAVIAFIEDLAPPPPDHSITTIRTLMRDLFGRAVSNNELDRLFATAGRKADDRVDMEKFRHWFRRHETRLSQQAQALLHDLDDEWRVFTHGAAVATGARRRRERKEQNG